MTHAVDPVIAVFAIGVALLTCYGCLPAAMWVSSAKPPGTAVRIAGNTLALGVGLWSACTLEAVALGRHA